MISDAESIQDKAPELVTKVMSGELPIDKAAKTRQEKRQPNGSAKESPQLAQDIITGKKAASRKSLEYFDNQEEKRQEEILKEVS